MDEERVRLRQPSRRPCPLFAAALRPCAALTPRACTRRIPNRGDSRETAASARQSGPRKTAQQALPVSWPLARDLVAERGRPRILVRCHAHVKRSRSARMLRLGAERWQNHARPR